MRKKKFKLIGLLLVGVFLLTGIIGIVGCSQPAFVPPVDDTPIPPPTSVTNNATDWEATHTENTWISPAKVQIRNMYVGARAEWDLRMHNGNNAIATFAVKYRTADYTEAGYVKAPPEAESWIIIANSSPVLMPYETRNILIALEIPINATVTADNWEFWISVKDISRGGTIQTELCSRWLVQMQ